MSLNVYLHGEPITEACECSHCGHRHERGATPTFFDANCTHNLTAMASEAGIYEHLWRPEEIGIELAGQLIEPLRTAVTLMRSEPARFIKHNPRNGWGSYEHFVPWVERYLAACEEYPSARVRVSR